MEKGIAIADQASGVKVATRDAIEQTSSAENRVIQLVDFVSRTVVPSALRTAVTAADSAADIDGAATAWYTGRVAVGDKSSLVVYPTVAGMAGFTDITITPVIYGLDNAFVGCLAPKTIAKPAVPLMKDATDGVLPAAVWDLFGAAKVGLHVTAMTGTGTVTLAGGVL